MRLAPLLAAWLAALPAPLLAEPDAVLHGAVRRVLDAGADAEVLAALARRLAGGTTAPDLPAEVTLPRATARVETGEIQAALTQLTILVGGNGQLTLQRAQGGQTDVVQILSGTARLADLTSDLVQRRGGVWHLSRPLVIWPGAALALHPGEVLELDSAGGAFVLSFGTVVLDGATLRGDAGQNATVPAFRPFLLVAGQGALRANRAHFQDLGFPGATPFRGVSVLNLGLLQPDFPSVIISSRFDRVHSLGFEGTNGLILAGNRVTAAGGAAIRLRDAQGPVIADNRIRDTGQGAGLRLSGQLAEVQVTGNRITTGGGNGMQIDGAVTGLDLRANVVLNNSGAGIVLGPSACVTVRGNILVGNRTTGLRLSGTGDAQVTDNAIHRNGSAGIEVQDQAGRAPVLLSDNVLADNREGLRAAGLGEVRLSGNDLADQTPRQFAGDFSPWLSAYLTAGDDALIIPAALGTSPGTDVPCKSE
jgi:hypothetical protein